MQGEAEDPRGDPKRLPGGAAGRPAPGSVINVHTEPRGPDGPVSEESDGSPEKATQVPPAPGCLLGRGAVKQRSR